MDRLLPLFAALAAFVLWTPAVHGESICGPRKDVVAYFNDSYGEVPQSVALMDVGSLIEVLVSPEGSWTMIVTTPLGRTCVIATGQHWQLLEAPGQPAT